MVMPKLPRKRPGMPATKAKGKRKVKLARQGKTRWVESFDVRMDPNNKEYYWLMGKLEIMDHAPDTDEIAVRNGFISVTPIHYDLTDYVTLEKLRKSHFDALL